jgi:hypothetical protein
MPAVNWQKPEPIAFPEPRHSDNVLINTDHQSLWCHVLLQGAYNM